VKLVERVSLLPHKGHPMTWKEALGVNLTYEREEILYIKQPINSSLLVATGNCFVLRTKCMESGICLTWEILK